MRTLVLKGYARNDYSYKFTKNSCFYIKNELLVRGSTVIKLPDAPPPDLVIESDYTNSSINKLAIYAELGITEIWRYRRQTVQVYQLVEANYQLVAQSLAFPFLPVDEIPGFIEQSRTIGQRKAVRLFRQRIKEILANDR